MSAARDGAPFLSPDDLERLCAFVYASTGMMFGESKRYYIDRRISQQMDRAGVTSFAAYMSALRRDPREVEQLINSFTINETYFYREEHQLKCLSRSLLPEIVATRKPGDRIRIWSVPCATGEEPYSIAIWLLENWRMVDAYNIEIVASDIDTRVIAGALEGEYGARALAHLPADVVATYFHRVDEGRWRIIDDIKESVAFNQVNLVDGARLRELGAFDVIFCRNLLIYFDAASRLTAASNLHDRLNPGGFVCLGHTESMARILTSFEVRRFDDATVFQRGPDPKAASS